MDTCDISISSLFYTMFVYELTDETVNSLVSSPLIRLYNSVFDIINF